MLIKSFLAKIGHVMYNSIQLHGFTVTAYKSQIVLLITTAISYFAPSKKYLYSHCYYLMSVCAPAEKCQQI